MVAELREVGAVEIQTAGKNQTEVGGRAAIVEKFYWRLNEGFAPVELDVRPYVVSQGELANIDQRVAEATSKKEELKSLIAKRGELEAEVFMEQLDDPDEDEPESKAAKKLRLINEKVAVLEQLPKPNELMAELFFVRVIARWPFTRDGQPIPLTVEGIAGCDPIFLTQLREDLSDFFYGEKRRKKRK